MTPAARYGFAGWVALVGAAVALGWWLPLAVVGGVLLTLAALVMVAVASAAPRSAEGELMEALARSMRAESNRGGAGEDTPTPAPPRHPETLTGGERADL